VKNLLINPARVQTSDYYKSWRKEFRLAGFIVVTPYTAPPIYQTWDKPVYNCFTAIAHEAHVDGHPAFVLPVFFNDEMTQALFDSELPGIHVDNQDEAVKAVAELNWQKPAIAFFLGNDDWHYALRFTSFAERDKMIQFFGEDLGFLDELIGHN
jgi:hypothetical protein